MLIEGAPNELFGALSMPQNEDASAASIRHIRNVPGKWMQRGPNQRRFEALFLSNETWLFFENHEKQSRCWNGDGRKKAISISSDNRWVFQRLSAWCWAGNFLTAECPFFKPSGSQPSSTNENRHFSMSILGPFKRPQKQVFLTVQVRSLFEGASGRDLTSCPSRRHIAVWTCFWGLLQEPEIDIGKCRFCLVKFLCVWWVAWKWMEKIWSPLSTTAIIFETLKDNRLSLFRFFRFCWIESPPKEYIWSPRSASVHYLIFTKSRVPDGCRGWRLRRVFFESGAR